MTTRKGAEDIGNNIPFKKPKLQPPTVVQDMWDDSDDDDLILLASQQVEQNNGGANSTFSAFLSACEKDAKTSTQHVPSPQPPTGGTTSIASVNVALRAKVTSNLLLHHQDKASQDYLRKRIEALEKDMQKSKTDLQLAQERIQIKDYEVSSLKYELKELQKGNSDLRMKLVKNEQFNKEIQKNKAMEKQLQRVETELELKSIELLRIKSDRRMSTGQVPMDVTFNAAVAPAAAKIDLPEIQSLRLDTVVPGYAICLSDSWQFHLRHRIFENSPSCNEGMGSANFVEQLTALQRAIGLLVEGHLERINVTEFVTRTLEGMRLALDCVAIKCDSNIQNLVNGSNKHRGRRSLLSNHNAERIGVCIYDKEAMYDNEELIIFRRILSIFALGCRQSPIFRKEFYETALCDILVQILQRLARTPDEYQNSTVGVVQAAAVLFLNSLEGTVEDELDPKNISALFKALVFCRMDTFTLYTLIKLLNRLPVTVTRTFLCGGCAAKEFAIHGSYRIAQFTTNSCLLQILATSVESAYPVAVANSKEYWSVTRYRKLLLTTKSIMQLFRRGIVDLNADWMQTDRSCLCYIKLTTSCIILAHLSLHLFDTMPKLRTEMRQVQAVSQLSLLLIYDIFTANLQMKLLQSMGRPIKNRLIVLYHLLVHYNEVFHFRLAQVKALESFEVNLLSNAFVRPENTAGGVAVDQQKVGKSIWDSVTV